MRTEKEIRARLAYVRRELPKVVTLRNRLWRVMELQIYEFQLMWVLKEKREERKDDTSHSSGSTETLG